MAVAILPLVAITFSTTLMAQSRYYTQRGDRLYNSRWYSSAYEEYKKGVAAGEVGSAEAIFFDLLDHENMRPRDFKAAEKMVEKWYTKSERICLYAFLAYLPKDYYRIKDYYIIHEIPELYHQEEYDLKVFDDWTIFDATYLKLGGDFHPYARKEMSVGAYYGIIEQAGWKKDMKLSLKYLSYWLDTFFPKKRSLNRDEREDIIDFCNELFAYCYENGIGGYPKDENKALEMYFDIEKRLPKPLKIKRLEDIMIQRSAEWKAEADSYRLGVNGKEKDIAKALTIYQRIQDQESIDDMIMDELSSPGLWDRYDGYPSEFRNEMNKVLRDQYSFENYKKGQITLDDLTDFINSCPNKDLVISLIDQIYNYYDNYCARISNFYPDYYKNSNKLEEKQFEKLTEMEQLIDCGIMSNHIYFMRLYEYLIKDGREKIKYGIPYARSVMLNGLAERNEETVFELYNSIKKIEELNPKLYSEFLEEVSELDALHEITKEARRVVDMNDVKSISSYIETHPDSPFARYLQMRRNNLNDEAAFAAAQKLTIKSSKKEIQAVLSMPMTDETRQILTKYASKKGLKLKDKYKKMGKPRTIVDIASEVK